MKKLIFFLSLLPALVTAQSNTNGLVGYWPQDGNANAISPYGNHGTTTGTSATTNRRNEEGKALQYDGTTSMTTFDISGTDLNTAGTISMWISTQELVNPGEIWIFFDVMTATSNSDERIVLWKNESTLIAGVDHYSKVTTDISGWNTNPGDWHHIAMTWETINAASDFVRLYVDGSLVGEAIGAVDITAHDNTAYVGTQSQSIADNPYKFTGAIDEISLYDRALTTAEIAALDNAGEDEGDGEEVVPVLPESNLYIIGESIGIGTTTAGPHALAVEGTIGTRGVQVLPTGWSDFVFDDQYELRPLTEVEHFITENHHLPEIPNASEVLAEGIELGTMNAMLLQKIEELTLYLIEQNKEIENLKKEVLILKEQQLDN